MVGEAAMSDKAKLIARLCGALILASVGLSLGYILWVSHPAGLWLIPFGISLGAATASGFVMIWLNRVGKD